MEAPDGEEGQGKQREIRDGIDNRGGQDHHVDVHATTWGFGIPDLLPWNTSSNLNDGVGQVERRIKPQKQVDEDEHPSFFARSKDAEVEEQDG